MVSTPRLATQIRRVGQGLFAGNLPVGLSCSYQVAIQEGNGKVSYAPLLLEELLKPCSGLLVTQYYHRLAPQTGLLHTQLYKVLHERG